MYRGAIGVGEARQRLPNSALQALESGVPTLMDAWTLGLEPVNIVATWRSGSHECDVFGPGGLAMRVLVAGPSGVLGRPTVRRLVEAGHAVIGLVRGDVGADVVRSLGGMPVPGNVLDADAVLRAAQDAEAVLNLVPAIPTGFGVTRSEWDANEQRRLEVTRNLIRACQAAGVGVFVQQSVHYVYGDQGEQWVDEELPPPRESLLPSALEAERLAVAANSGSLETVILRLGTVYGHDAWHTQLLVSLARKRQLPTLGDGKGYWSLIHAEDAAQAIVLAMEDGPAGSIYNVGDNEPVRMAELVTHLADQLAAPSPWNVPTLLARAAAGKDVVKLLSSSIRLSNRLLRQELGFAPAYPTFREGLAQVLAQPMPEPL